MIAPITSLYAALLGLVFLGLSVRIPRLRLKYRVGIGDGGQPTLSRAIRAHANFAEYVPFTLLLLILVECQGASAWFLHALGLLLLGARVAHAYGLSRDSGPSQLRFIGTLLTFFVIITGSLMLLLGAGLSWLQ